VRSATDTTGSAADPLAEGSLARGLALLAVLSASVVAWRVVLSVLPSAPPAVALVCAQPVEVVTDGGELHLDCADNPSLVDCSASAGDRVVMAPDGSPCQRQPGAMSAAARLLFDLPLDINRISAADFALLEGVGQHTARAIVSDRDQRGRFTSIEDLSRVRGVGAGTVARLRPLLQVAP